MPVVPIKQNQAPETSELVELPLQVPLQALPVIPAPLVTKKLYEVALEFFTKYACSIK